MRKKKEIDGPTDLIDRSPLEAVFSLRSIGQPGSFSGVEPGWPIERNQQNKIDRPGAKHG